MTIAAGTRLGPYEIVELIGAGGMGEVYRATDTRLDRSVAVKVLSERMSGSRELRQRFEREARTISSLNHPHICTLHDVGEAIVESAMNGSTASFSNPDATAQNVSYLVMELLEGETIADRLTRGAMPLHEVLKYAIQIADALTRAHRAGIIHRDLKPGNIMITKGGAKLLDFGLAKIAVPLISADAPTEQHKPLTAEGTILGTFQYMAPEQLEGLEADARTDIFAFGTVLYEMVTGRRAFDGKTRTSLIAAIVDRDPPPISSLQPLSPLALERIIRTCLAKEPDERWQSAHDVLLQLRVIAEGGVADASGDATVAKPSRRARTLLYLAWVIAALATAAALAFFARARFKPAQADPPVYASISPPAGTEFRLEGSGAGSMALSPDGRYLTFTAPGKDGIARIWVRNFQTREARPLAGTEDGHYPFWSPDSRQIGFFVENEKLKTISVDGGVAVDICDVREARGGSWGRDGVILFTPHWRDPIYKVAATGGRPVALTKVEASRNETTHRWPFFLPDGKHFLFLAGSHTSKTTSGANAIYLGSIDGGEPRLLLHARSNVLYAAGHLLYLRDQELVAQRFDAKAMRLEGEPSPLADGVRYEKGFFQAVFAVSDRMLVYQGGGTESRSRLNWINRKGETVGSLTPEAGVFFDVAVSPNGKTAAAAVGDPADIWLFDLERGVRSRFTFDPWHEATPVWSPDSRTILYWSDRGIQADTLRKTIGATAETAFLDDRNIHEKPLAWSKDGRFVGVSKFSVNGSSQGDLWIHPTDPSSKPFPYMASTFNESDMRFSPDGRFVAYVSNESGRNEVYVGSFPLPAETLLLSTEGGTAPRWSDDGREVFYIAHNGSMMLAPVLSTNPLKTGAATALFKVPMFSAPDPFYDVTSDGQRFLINQPEQKTEEPVTVIVNWTSALKH